jgi:hypothetical protein
VDSLELQAAERPPFVADAQGHLFSGAELADGIATDLNTMGYHLPVDTCGRLRRVDGLTVQHQREAALVDVFTAVLAQELQLHQIRVLLGRTGDTERARGIER